MKNRIKYIYILTLLFACTIIKAQNINVIRFNNTVVYSGGSGVSVIIDPTGAFELTNQFILQLSDVGGTWNNPTTLKTLSEFYVPVINGTLPNGLSAGSYKLRVISTLPSITVETASFSVVNGTSTIPNFQPIQNNNATNSLFCCFDDCSTTNNIFGQRDVPTLTAGNPTTTNILSKARRTNRICNPVPGVTYQVYLTDLLTSTTINLPITDNTFEFELPDNLSIGTYVVEITAQNSNIVSTYSNIFIFHGNGTSLENSTGETICIGDAVSFTIGINQNGIGRNYRGSTYTLDYGDGTTESFTHAQLLDIFSTNKLLTHIYNTASCGVASSGTPGYYQVKFKLFNKGIYNSGQNANYCSQYYENGGGKSAEVNTSQAPIAEFEMPDKQCISQSIYATNTTVSGQYGTANCSTDVTNYWYYQSPEGSYSLVTNQAWLIGKDLQIPASFIANKPGCWKIKLEATNLGSGCNTVTQDEKIINIESIPSASFTYSPALLCNGETVAFTNTSNVVNQPCQAPTYTWSVTPVPNTTATIDGFQFTNSTTKFTKDIQLKFTHPGSYTINLTVENSCGTSSYSKTIENRGDPSVSFNLSTLGICSYAPANSTIDFNTTNKPVYSIAPYTPTSYDWTISGTGVTASDYEYTLGSNAASAYPKIIFKAYKTFIINVKVTGNCNGSNQATFALTLNETPAITNVDTIQTICSGTNTTAIPLTSSLNGTTYTWEVTKTANISTPISNGNGGTIPAIVITNNSTTPGTVIYKVTPTAIGCPGSSKDFVITVNPIPVIGNLTETICSGSTFSKTPIDGNGNIVPSGTTYSWANPVSIPSNAITGGSAQTGKSVIGQTLTNTTNNIAILTYTITPKSGSSGSCDGQPFTVIVTVNPTPVLTQPENEIICNNLFTNQINFVSNVIGTTFNWTNSNSSIGLSLSGTGDISSFKAINTGNTPQVATISITPVFNGCNGSLKTFTITVNPTPQITTQPQSSDVCINGTATLLSVSYTDGTGTPSYQWYSNINDSNIGGLDIAGATSSSYNPPTNSVGKTYYYCVIIFPGEGCTRTTSNTATVTINPSPKISTEPLSTQRICVGGAIIPLTLNYTGGTGNVTYQWYSNTINSNISGTQIAGATAASYSPPTFNTVGTFYYYAIVSLNGSACGSTTSQTAEVNVIADPKIINQPLNTQTICQSTAPEVLTVVANVGEDTYSYQWYSNATNSIIGGTEIPTAKSSDYTPPTNINGTKYYYCVISQTGLGCAVTSEISEVIVNLGPTFTAQPQSSTVCKGEIPTVLKVTYKDGVGSPQYQWYICTSNDKSTGTAIQNEITDTYHPSGSTVGIFYYFCIITLPTGGCSSLSSDIAIVTVNQYPVISDFTLLIGSGTSFTVTPITTLPQDIVPTGTTYTWTMPIISPANTITGASAQSNPQTSISQILTNLTKITATVTYTVKPVSGTCSGNEFKIVVTVNSPINPNTTITDITCFGANNGSIQINIEGGSSPYNISWTGSNGFNSSEPSISGLTPGDYQLNITDARGLTYINTYTIKEPADILITTNIEKDVSCNNANDGNIEISVTGGVGNYKYNWTKNNVPFAITESIINLGPGIYKLTTTDSNNCVPKTSSYIIKEPLAISIDLMNVVNNLCSSDAKGSIVVAVSGGMPFESNGVSEYKYLWKGPNNYSSLLQNISNLMSGEYLLTVTDKTNCSKELTVQITQPDNLTINVLTTPTTCYGANDASIKLEISGGTEPYQIYWSNYGKGTYQDNLSPGDYTITVTDVNLCQVVKTINIDEALFSIRPIVKNISCFGNNDGSINLNIVGGVPPISLNWADNPTAGYIRNRLGPGTYKAILSDGSGCVFSKSFTIIEPLKLKIGSEITNAFECNNPNSGSIDITVSGGTFPYKISWSNGSTTEDLKGVPGGIYVVTIIDSLGCELSQQFEITRPEPLTLSVIIDSDFNCQTNAFKKICTAQVTGGLPPYTYRWSSGTISGLNNEIMETNKPGIIVLGVTDGIGCTTSYTFNLSFSSPGINYQLIDCNKHSFDFNAIIPSGLASDYSFKWDFGDGLTDVNQYSHHLYSSSGIYKVILTLKSLNCSTTFQMNIVVDAIPVLKLNKLPIFCIGDSLLLRVSGADYYRWNDGTQSDSLLIKDPGNYSVTGISKTGCESTLEFKASNFESYNYSIQSDKNEISAENSDIQFWSESISYSEYFWDFGDGKNAYGNSQNHKYDITRDGYFDVKLKVENPNGCLEYATKRIWITIASLDNTFTPNGDGVDDVFMKNWHIKVYNRNGIMLYDGRDGWDGTYKGKPVTNGTYFFVVYYSTGANTKTNSNFVTVIR